MAYVLTQPRALAAAAANVAGVGSALNEANVTAAGPTTGVLAAAADEVSAATATLFSSYARGYQALTKQAAAFHDEFARVLAAAGNFRRDLRDRSLALVPAPNRHDDVGAGGRQSFRGPNPRPLLAPVTTANLPDTSGTSSVRSGFTMSREARKRRRPACRA